MSFFSFTVGIVVLIITFFFSYAVVWFGMFGVSAFSDLVFGKVLHLSSNCIFTICSLFLVLLFIENYRTSREYLNSYVLQNPMSPGLVAIAGLGVGLVALLANPDASGKIISDLLFIGPRITTYSILTLRRAFRLIQTDLATASETLTILARRLHRTSANELSKLLLGRDPMKILFQLQEIGCVLFLSKEPAGVILTEEIREELNRLLGSKIDFESAPTDEPTVTATPEDLEYYKLLGLQPAASLAEIKAAYRKRIKQCHPDKFVGRGAEFRQLAEERAKAINAAYDILLAKRENEAKAK
jgi:DnaJ-domain-containing protein 1